MHQHNDFWMRPGDIIGVESGKSGKYVHFSFRMENLADDITLWFPDEESQMEALKKCSDLYEDLRHQAERDRVAGEPRVEKVGVESCQR